MRGSCLCRTVRYEVVGDLDLMYNCHCPNCRKSHGAAFATVARVRRERFRWISGEESVSRYESSREVARYFCGTCAANLFSVLSSRPEFLHLRLGTLDDDPGLRPSFHMFVGSKAPWFEINDDLPRYQAFPDPDQEG